jgi:uncharacterized membrane protein YcaP (DUF421 family)
MEGNLFFESWTGMARVAVLAVCAYALLIFLLRITGKRTLSKMNAFDFVVTVALGSTLATILLSKDDNRTHIERFTFASRRPQLAVSPPANC